MGLWIIVVAVGVVVVGGAVFVAMRRRGRTLTTEPTNPPPAAPVDIAPMGDLEAALNQVIDRDGKTISEHLEAESAHVDDLRVDNDTGPLLRRALDHVVTDPGAAPASGDAAPARDQPDEH